MRAQIGPPATVFGMPSPPDELEPTDALDINANPTEWIAVRARQLASLVRTLPPEVHDACRRTGAAWILDREGVPRPKLPPRAKPWSER